MTTKLLELLPCPFCNAEPIDIAVIEEELSCCKPKHSYCYCTVCGAQTMEFNAVISRQEANEKAIECWNARAVNKVVDEYNELIFAVESKFTNESRHQTALRYIREAEAIKQQQAKN